MTDLTHDFDINEPTRSHDALHELMASFRANCPIGWNEHGGLWVVSDYKTISEILSDPELFSSRSVLIPEQPSTLIPIELDPPDHGKYRRLLQGWFSRPRMRVFEDSVRRIARECIAGFANGEVDLGHDYARVLPLTAIVTAIGAPDADVDRLSLWASHCMQGAGTDPMAAAAAYEAFPAYMRELIEVRRKDPRDDIMTHFLNADLDGEPFPDEALAGLAFFLVFAGFETTHKTLSGTLAYLAQNPDMADGLRSGAIGLEVAVEEFLRLFAGVTTCRTATRDCVVGGREIKEGQRLHLLLPSGSRDESLFTEPDEPDPERSSNRHLAFGRGVHQCVGMHLARIEMQVGLRELLEATESFELIEGQPPEFNMVQTWGTVRVPARIKLRTLATARESSGARP